MSQSSSGINAARVGRVKLGMRNIFHTVSHFCSSGCGMTSPTFCRRIVCPFVTPDAADDTWCLGVQDAWKHGCLPPPLRHQGRRVRASMLQDALDVQRDEHMRRPRLEARAKFPGAAMRSAAAAAGTPARGGAPFSMRQSAVAFLGMREDRRTISPSLLQPVVLRLSPRDPLRLHPTLSCAACPGGSVPRCSLLTNGVSL